MLGYKSIWGLQIVNGVYVFLFFEIKIKCIIYILFAFYSSSASFSFSPAFVLGRAESAVMQCHEKSKREKG